MSSLDQKLSRLLGEQLLPIYALAQLTLVRLSLQQLDMEQEDSESHPHISLLTTRLHRKLTKATNVFDFRGFGRIIFGHRSFCRTD